MSRTFDSKGVKTSPLSHRTQEVRMNRFVLSHQQAMAQARSENRATFRFYISTTVKALALTGIVSFLLWHTVCYLGVKLGPTVVGEVRKMRSDEIVERRRIQEERHRQRIENELQPILADSLRRQREREERRAERAAQLQAFKDRVRGWFGSA